MKVSRCGYLADVLAAPKGVSVVRDQWVDCPISSLRIPTECINFSLLLFLG
jgi:hypothetical protein